jgi:hypothetical protein
MVAIILILIVGTVYLAWSRNPTATPMPTATASPDAIPGGAAGSPK